MLRRSLLVIACAAVTAGAHAENWRITPSVGILETYTNNVNDTSSDQQIGDWITSLTAAIGISGQGARVKLNGSIAVTADLYARETQNNTIYPTVSLFGSVEAIEKFFFVDATANVSQTYQNAFGPQPGNNINATANRYTNQTYSVSPYIKGVFGGTDIAYGVRVDNYWTIASQFGDFTNSLPNTYQNNLLAYLSSERTRAGWRVEYTRNAYVPDIAVGDRTDTNGKYTIQVGRAIVNYQYDPALQLSLRGGYEKDDFLLTGSSGAIYGAGFQWNPNERTQVGGYWEERFFGSSYQFIASHRRPNSAFNANCVAGAHHHADLVLDSRGRQRHPVSRFGVHDPHSRPGAARAGGRGVSEQDRTAAHARLAGQLLRCVDPAHRLRECLLCAARRAQCAHVLAVLLRSSSRSAAPAMCCRRRCRAGRTTTRRPAAASATAISSPG